jgi:hypothetical protein
VKGNGFRCSIVERTFNRQGDVDPTALETAVVELEANIVEIMRRTRRNRLNRQVGELTNRRWFNDFAEAKPGTAVTIGIPLDRDCDHVPMDELQEAIDYAYGWSKTRFEERQAKHNDFVERLLVNHGRVTNRTVELDEFAHHDAVAHAIILAGLTPDQRSDRQAVTKLKEAINAFYNWLNGTSDGQLVKMGLTTGGGNSSSNRSKGNRHKGGRRPSGKATVSEPDTKPRADKLSKAERRLKVVS